jgi:hypothetical protein
MKTEKEWTHLFARRSGSGQGSNRSMDVTERLALEELFPNPSSLV